MELPIVRLFGSANVASVWKYRCDFIMNMQIFCLYGSANIASLRKQCDVSMTARMLRLYENTDVTSMKVPVLPVLPLYGSDNVTYCKTYTHSCIPNSHSTTGSPFDEIRLMACGHQALEVICRITAWCYEMKEPCVGMRLSCPRIMVQVPCRTWCKVCTVYRPRPPGAWHQRCKMKCISTSCIISELMYWDGKVESSVAEKSSVCSVNGKGNIRNNRVVYTFTETQLVRFQLE